MSADGSPAFERSPSAASDAMSEEELRALSVAAGAAAVAAPE